jgi:hypothetical protein
LQTHENVDGPDGKPDQDPEFAVGGEQPEKNTCKGGLGPHDSQDSNGGADVVALESDDAPLMVLNVARVLAKSTEGDDAVADDAVDEEANLEIC